MAETETSFGKAGKIYPAFLVGLKMATEKKIPPKYYGVDCFMQRRIQRVLYVFIHFVIILRHFMSVIYISTVNKSQTNPILKRNETFISLNAYDDIHKLLWRRDRERKGRKRSGDSLETSTTASSRDV
jgi:hypothetical protein